MDMERHLERHGPISYTTHDDAKDAWRWFRATNGLSATDRPLFTAPTGNVKFNKTDAAVYGLALAPADSSGDNVCRFFSHECRRNCVAYAGKGGMPQVQRVRVVRTKFLATYPNEFATLIAHEIAGAVNKHGVNLRIRMNTFSDLRWERLWPELFERFAGVRFYDYTKWSVADRQNLPANYRLTYSADERWISKNITGHVANGHNVAVVYNVKPSAPLPAHDMGLRVIDGDKSDDRFIDPVGVIVGLRAKGTLRNGQWRMVRTAS
jgi:hypothetical protein